MRDRECVVKPTEMLSGIAEQIDILQGYFPNSEMLDERVQDILEKTSEEIEQLDDDLSDEQCEEYYDYEH